jgi:biopolymer transport protein ExbB
MISILQHTWEALKLGGVIVIPLSLLAALAMALITDKAIIYMRLATLPKSFYALVETHGFSWDNLEKCLKQLPATHGYRKFFQVILDNRTRPAWWVESRAADEATVIEKQLSEGLWLLETIVTAAPLLGLLGTITGMMDAFKLIGTAGLVNPTGVTAGVAQALIATALGLFIAILALFAFNYFSCRQNQLLDELERLGTGLIDHIRLGQQEGMKAA